MFPSLTREKVMISANIQLMKNKLHPFNDYEVSYVARENCTRHVWNESHAMCVGISISCAMPRWANSPHVNDKAFDTKQNDFVDRWNVDWYRFLWGLRCRLLKKALDLLIDMNSVLLRALSGLYRHCKPTLIVMWSKSGWWHKIDSVDLRNLVTNYAK